ncbi:MAG: class I SAM-dependent methyltransferase [Thermoplasmata archaeon]|jgi:SAM-dependent methyltransferase
MEGARATNPEFDPKTVVRLGWNRVSTIYRPGHRAEDVFGHSISDHEEWLRPFFRTVPRGSEVLDLGCGCGVPDAMLLSDHFRVTGVDISDVQVERARKLVPAAKFVRADMTEVAFRPETFGGILCLYSLIHVPLDEQLPLISRIHDWLRPDGTLLILTGQVAYTGVEWNWLGSNAKMYWSHDDANTYERWLTATGFEVLRRTHVPEGGDGHALFLARKRRGRRTERATLAEFPGTTRAGRARPAGSRPASK